MPLDYTLREHVASGFVHYEYTDMGFVNVDTKGAFTLLMRRMTASFQTGATQHLIKCACAAEAEAVC